MTVVGTRDSCLQAATWPQRLGLRVDCLYAYNAVLIEESTALVVAAEPAATLTTRLVLFSRDAALFIPAAFSRSSEPKTLNSRLTSLM